MILEYEIMKYDGDLRRPNLFVLLSQDVCEDKIGSLLEVFPTQAKRQWFQRGGVLVAAAAARYRMQCAFTPCRSILRAENVGPRGVPRGCIAPPPTRLPRASDGSGTAPQAEYHRLQSDARFLSPLHASRGQASLAS